MSDEIKKGLLGIVVDETQVSKVMPEINSLTYRGYAVQDLCEMCRFEEAAYLILNGDLPNNIQLKRFEKEEKSNRDLTKNLSEIIKHMPKKSHPMDVARTAVSVMGLEDKETTDNSPEANKRKAMRIFAKTPAALAAFYRIRKGKKIIKPKKNLTFAENFFYMCFGKVPNKEIVKAFDVSLILYAEHSFNVSTFTARTITSSLSDIHGAITGAIASLKGPLHGGANADVMRLLLALGDDADPPQIEGAILDKLARKEKIPGFGHRVYRTEDPRATHLRRMSEELGTRSGREQWYEMSRQIEVLVGHEKNLNPNVDFYSASTYYTLGIKVDLFTPVFAVSRVAGWTAHILEQYANNRLIRPRADYTGELHPKAFVAIDQR